MATHFTGNDVDGISLTVGGDLWINLAGTTVTAGLDAFRFNTATDNRLIVQGTIASEDSDAITSDIGSYNLAIEVAATGYVSGASDGIELDDTGHDIVNHGTVTGFSDSGIETRGDTGVNASSITNYGSVYGFAEGVSMLGTGAELTNMGEITGGSRGVEVVNGNGSVVINGGSIAGDIGVYLNGTDALAGNRLINTGTITGHQAAVGGSASVEYITNAGTLVGNVSLYGGDDVVRNSGSIEGGVDLGDGADHYRARMDGSAGSIFGGIGNDTVLGGAGEDLVSAGEGDDSARGGGGDDTVTGEAGNDALAGSDGNDDLSGGAGGDTLRGNGGADALFGEEQNDLMFGGAGEDTLDGGRQNDTMFGGSGADDFVIGVNSDTDVVRDFERGVDTLDLSGLGFADLAAALATATTVNGNAVFAFGGNDELTVTGITVNQIAGDIFI